MQTAWGTLIAVGSGIGLAAIAAYFAFLQEKRSERRRLRERAAFEVYMLLLELNGQYFWIASKELRGEPSLPDVATRVSALAWRIADKLREADDVPYLEEILTVLMKEDACKTADARAVALDAVIKRIGDTVNPRYARAIQGISMDNLRGFGARPLGHRNNAPGMLGLP